MAVLLTASLRSPFTRVGGALAGWHPVDLAAELLRRLGEPGESGCPVDEVWVGCAEPVGAQGALVGRAAVLAAGWPDRIGAVTVERAGTSGTAALHGAVAALESGECDRVAVVGLGHASTVPPGAGALGRTYGRPWGDGPAARVADDGGLLPGPVAADRAAVAAGTTREVLDAWAVRSRQLRPARPDAVVAIPARCGDAVAVVRGTPVEDDDLREPPEDPAAMPPAFEPGGLLTGFTFAPPADGACALVLTRDGDRPATVIRGTGRAAGHPLDPLGGLESAVAAALRRAGVASDEVARWELCERDAASTQLAIARLGLDPDRVNPAGGALAVGDAGAAEELRPFADLGGQPDPGVVVIAAFDPAGAAATVVSAP